MQWQSLLSRFPNDLCLKNEESASCWPTILPYQKAPDYFQVFLLHIFLPKTLATFQPGHAPALRHSALTSPGVLLQSLKLQLSSEDAHSCNRFSNLISNVLGLIHLPIIYVHQAILEHQLILLDASFIVLRRWWPLLTQSYRKQGQLVVMSKFKLMESFISYTSVCPIFRSAKCYHAFCTA